MDKDYQLKVKEIGRDNMPTFQVLGTISVAGDITNNKLLFDGRDVVKMTYGKFPFDSYLDLYEHSSLYHIIGGVKVKVVGFTHECMNNGTDITNGCILVRKLHD